MFESIFVTASRALKRFLIFTLIFFGTSIRLFACETAATPFSQLISKLEIAWNTGHYSEVDRLQVEIASLAPGAVDLPRLKKHLAAYYPWGHSEMKVFKRSYDRWIKLFLPESRNFIARAAVVGATQAYSEYWRAMGDLFENNPSRRSETELRVLAKSLQSLVLRGFSLGAVPAESFMFVGGSWPAALAHAKSDIDAGAFPRNLIEASRPLPEHISYVRQMGTLIVHDEPESLLTWAYMGFVRCHRFVLLISASQIELLVSPDLVDHDGRVVAGFKRFKLDW